jgi:N-acetylglucosamine-6-sulfatase
MLPLLALVVAGCGAHHAPVHQRHAPALPIPTARETVFPPARPHHLRSRLHPRRPNIVFVLTDDLSGDLLRYLPAARHLAREGTSFRRYIVSDSLCCPSRASIFTGEYPHDTGVFTNVSPDGGIHA